MVGYLIDTALFRDHWQNAPGPLAAKFFGDTIQEMSDNQGHGNTIKVSSSLYWLARISCCIQKCTLIIACPVLSLSRAINKNVTPEIGVVYTRDFWAIFRLDT